MLWWFEREDRKTRVEVLQLSTGAFELHITDGSGVEHIENFGDAAELAKRQQQIQDSLISQGWKGPIGWMV